MSHRSRRLKRWLADRLGISRANAALVHLLVRDLNLFSRLPEGRAGTRALRDAFFALIPILRPTVFCDIGANDGSTAIAVREIAPDCTVYGFEANPHIHAKHAGAMAKRGIDWRNLAVSDKSARVSVFAPRTLSRAYINGEVVPAHIVETEDTGKTSLLTRNEAATYNRFDVDAVTLDDFFQSTTTIAAKRRFFLWIDVEGAADKVLAGADTILRNTDAIFIEAENFDFWSNQRLCGELFELLYRKNFLPVARDREYGDKQFNMLFVGAAAIPALHSAMFDASSPLRACLLAQPRSPPAVPRATFTSVDHWLRSEVPVLVPCFNNPTYVQLMLHQLRALSFKRITLIDNASTLPEMLQLLRGIGNEVTVIALNENQGPKQAVIDAQKLALLPRLFCVTDPDLSFNPALPDNFLGELARLTERHKVGKAGFALDISDRHEMIDKPLRMYERDWTIWDWEAQFWEKPLEELDGGDGVYDASIDTTFALYDKNYFDPDDFLRAVRVGGRFTARHLPWYRHQELPVGEAEYYRRTQKYSHYSG